MTKLGRIENVELRTIWDKEETGFTKWLAEPENLLILSESVGFPLELLDTELNLEDSKFHLDILTKVTDTDQLVVIENQLEKSDHDHLGKIMTYGAGYDAKAVIWIVKRMREEHKAAIEWINNHSDSNINIFGIEIELLKIEDSKPAPRFNVVVCPNDWAKTLSIRKMSDLTKQKFEFWEGFEYYLEENYPSISINGKKTHHYIDIQRNKGLRLICLLNKRNSYVGVEIYINDNKELFDELYANKEKIEIIIENKLEWLRLDEKKASRIKLIKDSEDPYDRTKQEEYYKWLGENLLKFQKAFNSWFIR